MPAADWTSISNGAGVFAITADATAPSPPSVMNISTGGQAFQNITAGPFKNSRITAWQRQSDAASDMYLCLRSLNTTAFIAAPSTFFLATTTARSAVNIGIRISAVVNGVMTTIFFISDIASVNGNPQTTWQQYQFSAFNSGTDILLRLSQWNGATFVPMADCAAPIATFPTLDAAGSCRFGALAGGAGLFIDDVNFYSLA